MGCVWALLEVREEVAREGKTGAACFVDQIAFVAPQSSREPIGLGSTMDR